MLPVTNSLKIRSMDAAQIGAVCHLEAEVLKHEQADMPTHHVLHGGIYSRTICMKADSVMVGALIKIPTTVTIAGDTTVYIGESSLRITGYEVFAAAAGRKQAFIAHADTYITMSFKTNAQTVEEAEQEFTDDYERLMSRQGENIVVIGDLA